MMLISITDCLMFHLADAQYNVSEDDWIIYNQTEYYFSKERMPVEKARNFCKKNGGDLAVIESESEKNFLWKYVRNMFYLKNALFSPTLRHLFQLVCEILESGPHHKKTPQCHISWAYLVKNFTIIIILINCYM